MKITRRQLKKLINETFGNLEPSSVSVPTNYTDKQYKRISAQRNEEAIDVIGYLDTFLQRYNTASMSGQKLGGPLHPGHFHSHMSKYLDTADRCLHGENRLGGMPGIKADSRYHYQIEGRLESLIPALEDINANSGNLNDRLINPLISKARHILSK